MKLKSLTIFFVFLSLVLSGQEPFVCDENAYLFQYNDIYSINLASGQSTLVKEDITPGNINAAAYNLSDNYIWGHISSPANSVVRIGKDMQADVFEIAGYRSAYVGAINSNGLYFSKAGGTSYDLVDLNPASIDYLKVIATPDLSESISIADWAFNPVDGQLYTVTNGTNILCRIDLSTSQVTQLGEVPVLSGVSYTYGAVYFDVDGNFYVSANQTGTIYIINEVQDVALGGVINSNFFAYGPASGSNDGARCPTAPVPQEICDNGLDDDGDGLIDCDDPSCSGVSGCATLSSTSGGSTGGLESNSRLSQLVSKRNYKRTKNPRPATFGVALDKVDAHSLTVKKNGEMRLQDLIPVGLLNETAAMESSPRDLIDITNASEVYAVDFMDNEKTKASVLALKTENGVYEHSKFICDRLLGAKLHSVSTIFINDTPFIRSIIYRPDGKREFVLSFAARRDGDDIVVESHWNIDKYSEANTFYNFQIWTSSIDDLLTLSEGILGMLQAHGNINEIQTSQPPYVFVQQAIYQDGTLLMDIMNNDFSEEVGIDGGIRRTETENTETYSELIPLVPYKNTIELKVGPLFDFGMRLGNPESGVPDDLFVSDGPWGIDDADAYTFVKSYEVVRSDVESTAQNHVVSRGVQFSAEVGNYVAAYRALTPRFEAINLEAMNRLSFYAEGEGELEVTLIKANESEWEKQPRTVVLLSEEGGSVSLDRAQFCNTNGSNPDWSDIKLMVFTVRNNDDDIKDMDLLIKEVVFDKALSTSTVDTEMGQLQEMIVTPNPATSSVRLSVPSLKRESADLKIINTQGLEVGSRACVFDKEGITLPISIDNLSPGCYLLRVKSMNGYHTTTLVIQ